MNTLTQVSSALRKKNKKQYFLVTACVFASVLLITALSVMMQSNTVMRVLPEGGDSRKQMYMIFAIAVAGCAMFTVYASSLFFKSKSREVGIMMALGATKRQLSRQLLGDVGVVAALSSVAGLVLGTPLSFAIWQIFRMLVVDSVDMAFSISPTGYLWGGAFAIVCAAMLFMMTIRFLRRSNIMDIMNEQRKSEPIRDVKSWYGVVGLVMLLASAAAGFSIGNIFVSIGLAPPPWAPLLFLPIAPGLYMLLVYVVVRGGGKKNYHKNIISRSIMRFQGRQTVRNMAVITALVGGAVFAICYIVMNTVAGLYGAAQLERDFLFHYRSSETMSSQSAVEQMAVEEGVQIEGYTEAEAITLAADGYYVDYENDGTISRTYHEMNAEWNFLPLSEFNRLSGQNEQLPSGSFAHVTAETDTYSPFETYKDIGLLTNPVTGETMQTSFQGELVYGQLIDWMVVSDADYAAIGVGLIPEWQERVVQFDVANADASYDFATRLKNALIDSSSPAAALSTMNDRMEARWTDNANATQTVNFDDRESSDFNHYWKFRPSFRILDKNNMLRDTSVYIMLFAFISIVCFAAVYVIAYTRSVTIGLVNKQVYNDLTRLGANRGYLRRSIRGQISKVYVVPTVIGCSLMFLLYGFMMTANSGALETGELIAFGFIGGFIALIGLLTFGLYRKTLGTVYAMLGV
jgi:hypothetical protein